LLDALLSVYLLKDYALIDENALMVSRSLGNEPSLIARLPGSVGILNFNIMRMRNSSHPLSGIARIFEPKTIVRSPSSSSVNQPKDQKKH
jgi:hypothetical protein